MSLNTNIEEIKSRFVEEQVKRIKKELLLIYDYPEKNMLPEVFLIMKADKKTGLFLKVKSFRN